ncbi:MAG: helix-turn-helix domain-containing protein [Pseudomonadota bacterium]
MPDWTKAAEGTRRIDVLLFPRFSNHCLANAVEPLRAANGFLGRAAYAWRFATVDGAPVASSSGLPVLVEDRLSRLDGGDALIVMPSYGFRALATPACLAALKAAARRYGALIALDTGSWLIAAAGLLEGRRATIHADEADAFAEQFPEVSVASARWVVDGDRISAGGAMTTFELMLELIEREHGAALRLSVAGLFMQQGAGGHGRPRATSAEPRDSRVGRALTTMQANLEAPVSIGAAAAAAGCTQRDLEGRFRRSLGASPRTVYRRLRLDRARAMVEDGELGIGEIALRCGYGDASAFTRAFRREFAESPQAMRRRTAPCSTHG